MTSPHNVMDFLSERMEELNEIHLTAALSKIAYLDSQYLQHIRPEHKGVWQSTWSNLQIFIPGLDTRGISSILKSATRLKYTPGNTFLLAIEEQCCEVVDEFTALDVVTFWEAFASFRVQPEEELMNALHDRLMQTHQDLKKHTQASGALWALKKLDYEPSPELLNALYERKISLPERKLSERILKAPSVSVALKVATDRLDILSGRDVTTCLSKIAKIDPKCIRERRLSDEDLDRFDLLLSLLPRVIPRLNAGGLVILITSMAKISLSLDQDAMDIWNERFMEEIEELRSGDIARTLWAFAVLSKVPSGEMLTKISSRSKMIQASFSGHDYANAFWALATFSRILIHTNPETADDDNQIHIHTNEEEDAKLSTDEVMTEERLVDRLETVRHLRFALQRTAVTAAEDFSPETLSRILWSFGKDGSEPSMELMDALIQRIPQIESDMRCQDISLLIWSLARLGHNADENLMKVLLRVGSSNVKKLSIRELRSMRWGIPILEKRSGVDASDILRDLDARAAELLGAEGSPTIDKTSPSSGKSSTNGMDSSVDLYR
ncbi:hypothetical protein AAMO2058_001680200 [Amorphochlora amoebiformis]